MNTLRWEESALRSFLLLHVFRSYVENGINNEVTKVAKFTDDTDVLRTIKSKTG